MNPLIMGFLKSYVDYIGWPNPPKDFDAILRRICEEQTYSPEGGREFLLIAFGWMWGHSKIRHPYIEGSVQTGWLKFELDKVYEVVAKEQGWDA
jgi:hypothetical protein